MGRFFLGVTFCSMVFCSIASAAPLIDGVAEVSPGKSTQTGCESYLLFNDKDEYLGCVFMNPKDAVPTTGGALADPENYTYAVYNRAEVADVTCKAQCWAKTN